jgi:hypothetical protein
LASELGEDKKRVQKLFDFVVCHCVLIIFLVVSPSFGDGCADFIFLFERFETTYSETANFFCVCMCCADGSPRLDLELKDLFCEIFPGFFILPPPPPLISSMKHDDEDDDGYGMVFSVCERWVLTHFILIFFALLAYKSDEK